MKFSRKPFAASKKHRKKVFNTCENEGPLIAQFCGIDPEEVLLAAKLIQNECDAVDINFGCPQLCARKGGYGAFLLDYPEKIVSLISHLHQNLEVPVTCKMRLLPSLEETISLAIKMQDNGCQMLAVHGRTRDQKGKPPPPANWDAIREIKRYLRIPLVANGGISNYNDAEECLKYTGADSVMSGYGLLQNPTLFSNRSLEGKIFEKIELAKEYLEITKLYPAERKSVDLHLYPLLKECFDKYPEYQKKFAKRKWTDDPMVIVKEIEDKLKETDYKL